MKQVFTLAFILFVFSLKAQYTTYEISNVGSIDISDEMELQGGDYRKVSEKVFDKVSNKIGYDIDFHNRIVFQPKGINTFDTLKESYARIIIQTEYGEFEPLTSVKPKVSVEEIRELEVAIKEEIVKSFKGTALKLVQFYGVSFEKINNQVALKSSYTRRLGDNPLVRVDSYIFENNDRMHTFILSYRIEHEHLWKDKLQYALHSFKIIKQ